MSIKSLSVLGAIGVALAGAAAADTVTISLGASAQNYVLYGQGAYSLGLGSFTNQQGDESYDAGTNTTTDTLTGAITGSNIASLSSGTYSLVTTYTGTPIGSGGFEIQGQSSSTNPNYFYYSYLDPSVDMTAYLSTPGGPVTIPLVTGGGFSGPGFSFAFTSLGCTGVAVCTQNDVGLTPGATGFSPTTISITYTTTVPEPAAWSLMLLGVGALGGALRGRRFAARTV